MFEKRTNKLLLMLLILLLGSSTCSPVLADIDLKKDLGSGKAVVFIINATERPESEQYADWSHYLNQFSSEVGKNYVFYKLSAEKLSKLVSGADEFKNEYSMIFMKSGNPSFFYDGPIVEPQVYKYVKLIYLGEPIQPSYLNQFAPQNVKIKVK